MGEAVEIANAPRACRLFRSVPLLWLILLEACASPGPPRPPSLNLPEIVAGITADRVGNRVELRWTTPGKTTDGLDVRGPMSATVCRGVPALPDQGCAVVLRLPVAIGPSKAVDQLPASLTAGPVGAVEYRLEILNARGRSAGQTSAVFAASGPAPDTPRRLQAEATQAGAVLRWYGEDVQDPVELRRMTEAVVEHVVKPTKQSALGAKPTDSLDLVLRVAPGEGALDRTARMGERYVYTAQRVRTVSIGEHTLEVRSAVSAPVALEMRDLFPPCQPTGLEAIAGEHEVDLSWEPNTEADLAGYIVQRQEDAVGKLLNGSPVPQPSFQDKTVVPGHTYQYSVVAVDRAGNRSPASELVPVSVRADVP